MAGDIMELQKIKGNSYFLNAPTNIGVYIFKNKNCLLVDTGSGTNQVKKITEQLEINSLHPKYIINTHSHEDHSGSNYYFKENYPGTIFYASEGEKIFLENPYLLYSMLFSSNPIKEVNRRHRACNIDYTLEIGLNKINDEKFEILNLAGHTKSHIGIITSDLVCYVGDAVLSEDIISKYTIPFIYNVEDSIQTLNRLKDAQADYFVIGHAESFYNKEAFNKLLNTNLTQLRICQEQILDLLDRPLSREDILENLIILNELPQNFNQYHLYLSSISSYLTYLSNNNMLQSSVENGKIYYYQ